MPVSPEGVTEFNINEVIAAVILSNEERFLAVIKDLKQKAKIRNKYKSAFEGYLGAAFEKYSKVKTLLYRNEPRYLYDFFVCTGLTKWTGHGKQSIVDCSNVDSLLNESKYCIIQGSGGAGKSILMRHFFINALQQKRTIPIFVELRNFTEKQSLSEYIFSVISRLGFDLEYKYFEYALDTGGYLLLLDGFDEINYSSQSLFLQQLDLLCDKYPNNYYFVSSRPDSSNFVSWQRFTVFNTTSLTIDNAVALIEKLDYDPDLREKFIIQLREKLYVQHTSFASNPLLLSIMLMTFDNYSEIPEKKHLFYQHAYDALYAMHDATKGGFHRTLRSNLSSDIFKNIFSQFCFHSYLQSKTEFNYSEITGILGDIQEINEDLRTLRTFSVEDYIYDLITSVCLMYTEGRNYLFTHRSFQEYFSALFIKNLPDSDQKEVCKHLIEKSGSSIETDSVFEMLYDMIPIRFEKNILIPYLEEIEKNTIENSDLLKKYFIALVDKVAFIDIGDLKDFDIPTPALLYAVRGYEKTHNLMVITLNQSVSPEMFRFIGRHYSETKNAVKNAKKIDVRYLQTSYSSIEVTRDAILFEYLCSSPFGKNIKALVGLLPALREKSEGAHNSVLKYLLKS